MGIVRFRAGDTAEVPRPVCSRPGDVHEQIVFTDDLPLGMSPGGFVLVLVGAQAEGAIHAIETADGPTLANLSFNPNGLTAYATSLHTSYPSRDIKLRDTRVIGRVTDFFPTGDPKVRWVFYEEGLEFHPRYELPFYQPRFRR